MVLTEISLGMHDKFCFSDSQRDVGVQVCEPATELYFSGDVCFDRPARHGRSQLRRSQLLNGERTVNRAINLPIKRHCLQVFDLAGKSQLRLFRGNRNIRDSE